MTTNNLTERMHKTVEARRSGTQTVISFIERLYGIKIFRDSLIQNELGETSFNAEITEKIDAMINKLVNRDNINKLANYYLVNIISGECTCYDYIWNGPYHDVCKHVHATRLYIELLHGRLQVQDVKQSLVKFFKDKEHAIALEKKNHIIYNGTIDEAYQEILRLFNYVGNDIFFSADQKIAAQDPFRPISNMQIPMTLDNFQESVSSQSIDNSTTSDQVNSVQNYNNTPGDEKENDSTLAIKRSLEELFLEKKCFWNPKEFTNIVVTKKLCLDDDPTENGLKMMLFESKNILPI
ncbi:17812_t:CDS:2 [Cetraspora pellucida]|uniref:17812_t:CDS:1 n=1 Tax=Cetraspora pellucida TaxID=1433469 RepID=A0A9N9FTS1_9GLOM|nr:17812_t:CDS:2 [Cetraspora pellucida]